MSRCRKGSGEYALNTVLQPPNQKSKAVQTTLHWFHSWSLLPMVSVHICILVAHYTILDNWSQHERDQCACSAPEWTDTCSVTGTALLVVYVVFFIDSNRPLSLSMTKVPPFFVTLIWAAPVRFPMDKVYDESRWLGQLIVDQLKTSSVAADLRHVSRAGQQVFLEQPTSFNATLIRAIKAPTNSVEHTCNVW